MVDADLLGVAGQMLYVTFSLDAQGRVTYVNDAVRLVLGYGPDELLGTSLMDYVPAEERAAVEAGWARVASGQPPERVEATLRRRDGRLVTVQADALPRLGADGGFAGLDGVACEVRAAAPPREALSEQLACLRSCDGLPPTAEHLSHMLGELSECFVTLGAEACWIGLLSEGTLNVRPVVHRGADGGRLAAGASGQAPRRSLVARAIITRQAVAVALDDVESPECPLAAEAGRCGYRSLAVLPLLYAGRPYGVVCVYSRTPRAFDGGKLRLLGLFAHLAAVAACHGEAAAGAGRIEMGFRDLVDQLPCVAYVVTAAVPPEFLYVSSSVESFLGYTPQEFYADPTLTVRVAHPDDRARVEERMRLGARTLAFLTTEFRVVHRNGADVYHVVLRSRPLEEQAGLPLLRQGILIDVTEQKRLEQELLQSQRLAAIGEMAAMMAHEIRNPLAGMSLALRVLRGARGDRETEDECLDDLAQCLGRINATVSRALDFSKARPVVLRPCALAAIVEGAQHLTATYVRTSGVTLHVDLAEDLPALVADRDEIEQVIVNLVLNACKAMPDGGAATIRAGATAAHVFVEVSDTGIGITPEQLGHVFDPFYSGFGEGTGLGLSLCQRIVEAHGGRIEVASRPGEGSTFRIELPRESADAASAGD